MKSTGTFFAIVLATMVGAAADSNSTARLQALVDAEAAPDPDAAADYAHRYANWRLLTDKLGEWGKWKGRVVAPRLAEKGEI